MRVNFGKRLCSLLLVFAFVFLLIPSFDIQPKAAEIRDDGFYHFTEGEVAVINQDLVTEIASDPKYKNFAQSPSFIIEQGVYSVTIKGPFTYEGRSVSVNIVFGTEEDGEYQGVTIDRTNESGNGVGTKETGRTTLEQLYTAGQTLGWRRPNNNNSYYVPTAPFLITGGAKVNALFLGDCTFKAGTNQAYVTQQTFWGNTTYSWGAGNNRGGYAGIQVDGDSSLTILDVITNMDDEKLSVYGGHQLPGANEDPLDVNPKYEENNAYRAPSGSTATSHAGGAGIGGGARYGQTTAGGEYYADGTPGEIIINGGKIYAVGGHLAAGIGGGLNGAATKSKIEINGGDITAIGGRFATGIGDGDSINGNTTRQYSSNNQILINGGNIIAYGGTASAAIGTTDNLSIGDGRDQISGLQIVISGGTIQAQSGEADASKGGDNQIIYTAAIGVGQGTNMNNNSITIHSDATVFARSFSQYAISNKGVATDSEGQNIPMVNIDPDGFMYLARFDQQDYERRLTLYPVFTDTMGNPVSVQTEAYKILDGASIEKYYAQTEETNDEGQPVRVLYDLNQVMVDNKPVFTPVLDVNNELQYLYTNGSSLGFSYYYDITAGQVFIVPPKYKAVALSLRKGDYVFHVPRGNQDNLTDDVFCHFSKHLSGTTSVEVEETSPSPTHFTYRYDQLVKKTTETPNVNIDKTAVGLESMQITASGNQMLVDEDEFKPTVLGYEVYIPNDSTSFALDFSYILKDPSIKGHSVQKISITQKGVRAEDKNSDTFDISGNQLDGDAEFTFQFTQTENKFNSYGEIWINKIDVIDGESVFVTYKVVVICKPKYYIHTESLSKKYDGVPVSPQITKVTETRGREFSSYYEPHYAYGTTLAEYGSHVSVHEPEDYNPSELNGGLSGQFVQTYKTEDNVDVTISYAVIPNATETAVSVITRFTYKDENQNDIHKRSTVNINMDGPELVFTLDDSSDRVLMPSQTGGYRIETSMEINEAGTGIVEEAIGNNQSTAKVTWTVSISHYDRADMLQPKTDAVLSFTAQEVLTYGEATDPPSVSGDGKTVYPSKEAALERAEQDARDAFEYNSWETRYSDSYFFATGIRKTETFTLDVAHEVNKTLGNFEYKIVDDHMYRYHKLHYYAELKDEGDVIPFTNDQIQEVLKTGCSYYVDDGAGNSLYAGDGILQEDELLSVTKTAPKDAGDYILVLDYVGDEYEAHTSVAFEIRKRPIRIVGVQNWLTYLTQAQIDELQKSNQPNHLKTYPENPLDEHYYFGEVYFDDVISGDKIELSDQVYAYYNEITISYNLDKITLRYNAIYQTDGNGNRVMLKGRQIDWLGDKAADKNPNGSYANANRNYELTGISNFDSSASTEEENITFSFVHVPGMLSYVAKGTIFKKATDDENSVWRKFWPTWSEEFLKWNQSGKTDAFGNFTEPDIMEENIDYYSPSNASHQDYVFIRTVNAERGKTYSIDIEYGSMEFQYAKAIWDVNTHQYVEGEGSYWNGNDGMTNRITIKNYSDVPIQYNINYEKHQLYGTLLKVGFSTDDFNCESDELVPQVSDVIVSKNKEANGNLEDDVIEKTFYFVVKGQPANRDRMQIGSIWLTIESYSGDE